MLIEIPDSLTKGVFGGIEFSPDSKKLFGFMTEIIYQVDLDTADIAGSLIKVSEWIYSDSAYGYFNDWQLAPDGKIYIQGVFCNPALSVINNPNAKGVAMKDATTSEILRVAGNVLLSVGIRMG